ncbi:TIGR04222 domain-containing membrane protein [Kitasatospora sp. NPDC002227]|uniref:TIGR04222 domain-containing membrane protein n=1 Tax=Kitasatospora sp. NPDC002227 TaxID=3154773 RepID=UPI0033301E99
MWYSLFVLAAVLVLGTGLDVSAARYRLRRVPNPSGLPGRALPLLDTAFLAGGPARVADTVIVRMQQEGRLVVSRDRQATVTDGQPRDEIEAVLIGTAGPGRRERLDVLRAKMMRSEHVQLIGDRLADRGLMRRPTLIRRVVAARWCLVAALLVTLVLGVLATVHWVDAPGQGTSTPPVFAFTGLFLLGLFWYAASGPGSGRITPAGLRQLTLMRQGAPWRPTLALTGGAALAAITAEEAVSLGRMALKGPDSLTDASLRAALLADAAGPVRGSGTLNSSGVGYDNATAIWCADSRSTASCGSSSHYGGSHHDGGSHSGGSSGHGGHSGHSCGGHSCGGHSGCGSSCGS